MELSFPIGTMIELPRAAMTAHEIADEAEFFSFGTNDMTQTTWGFSRDDVEAAFFPQYLEAGVFGVSPFETLDVEGRRADRVGRGVGGQGARAGPRARGVRRARRRPGSIHFFETISLDYVSCSPFRVPVARLEAGRRAAGVGARLVDCLTPHIGSNLGMGGGRSHSWSGGRVRVVMKKRICKSKLKGVM